MFSFEIAEGVNGPARLRQYDPFELRENDLNGIQISAVSYQVASLGIGILDRLAMWMARP